jgi:hypothetical protein
VDGAHGVFLSCIMFLVCVRFVVWRSIDCHCRAVLYPSYLSDVRFMATYIPTQNRPES